ncbi:MAG TPA: GNAT family protein [Aggregatilinea sp.]|uniref:GNAT family N-acetyltransferase n=1 Tax=Aggregatilinea sp. TaxID=2806333 RepID=UPI002B6E75AB|nr:GNAT family protein [Aggregatilinea sp.]HML24534.1 GNAT family protein [Aggregatilinea sp.]
MLQGLLVDLVPYGQVYRDLEHTWRNHEASFWSSGGDRPIVTHAELRTHFERRAEYQNRPDAGVTFGVQTKDGTPIGFFSINWLVPHHRLAMLGARIGDPAYWGGGYGTDALTLLVDYAFDWMDIHKVWLGTTDANARVQRQMEKVGFVLEARNRDESLMDGVWVDGLLYGILRDQWPGRAAVIERIGLKAHR